MGSIKENKKDIFIKPNSSFRLILNLKLLSTKIEAALARCTHNIQVLDYDNTNVEFECLSCEVAGVNKECKTMEPKFDEEEIHANNESSDYIVNANTSFNDKYHRLNDEKLLMSDIGEDEIELVDYDVQTDELLEENDNYLMHMLYPEVKIGNPEFQTSEDLLLKANDHDIPHNLTDMLYPDVNIYDTKHKKDENSTNEIEIINIEEQIDENIAKSKLETLQDSGAISITKLIDETEKLTNPESKKVTLKRKAPLLVDPNLPVGWKRKVVETVSETKGSYLRVKIFGEGRVFERKSELKKFLTKNPLLSLDPELFDFSVYGKKS